MVTCWTLLKLIINSCFLCFKVDNIRTKHSPRTCLSYTNSLMQNLQLQPSPLPNPHISSQYLPCPKSAWAKYHTTGGMCTPPKTTGIIQTTNLKLPTLPSLPFLQKPQFGLRSRPSPWPFCLLIAFGASTCGPEWHAMPSVARYLWV